MHLKNKVVLLTGGAQGLGKNICAVLLAKGCKVCFCDINDACGQNTLKELQSKYGNDNIMFVVSDITIHERLNEVFHKTKERFGHIDIVVNNAGILAEGPSWRKCVDVNLVALIDGCKLADDYMGVQNGGQGGVVLNISSIAGLTPIYIGPVYCATKSGIIGASRTFAARAEVRKTGIKFVCLCPDMIATGMGKQIETTEGMTKAEMEDTSPFIYDPSLVNPVDSVIEAVIQIIETDDNNGGVMSVTTKDGVKYIYGDPALKEL